MASGIPSNVNAMAEAEDQVDTARMQVRAMQTALKQAVQSNMPADIIKRMEQQIEVASKRVKDFGNMEATNAATTKSTKRKQLLVRMKELRTQAATRYAKGEEAGSELETLESTTKGQNRSQPSPDPKSYTQWVREWNMADQQSPTELSRV